MAADSPESNDPSKAALNDLTAFLVSVKAGETLFAEGDDSRDFFVIREGSIRLTRKRDGREHELERLGTGDCVGEASMLGRDRRSVTARAETDCTLVRIDLGTLKALLDESPSLALGLLRKLAGRLLRLERIEPVAAPAPKAKREGTAITHLTGPGTRRGTAPTRLDLAPSNETVGTLVPARLRHADSGRQFLLTAQPEAIVGRIDRATGFTPEINLSDLDEGRTIGRKHAKILNRNGEYFVREDAATRNGTFVNGTRLPVRTEQRLTDGDHLRFGLIEVVFERGS